MLNPVIHTLIYDTHVNISESYTLVDTNMKFHSLDTSGKKKNSLDAVSLLRYSLTSTTAWHVIKQHSRLHAIEKAVTFCFSRTVKLKISCVREFKWDLT